MGSRGLPKLVKRKVPIEKIGIDVSSLSTDELEEIALKASEELLSSLKQLIPRRDDYLAYISIQREGEAVNVLVNVEVEGTAPLTPQLEALIDEAVDKALKVVRDELKRRAGGRRKAEEVG